MSQKWTDASEYYSYNIRIVEGLLEFQRHLVEAICHRRDVMEKTDENNLTIGSLLPFFKKYLFKMYVRALSTIHSIAATFMYNEQ